MQSVAQMMMQADLWQYLYGMTSPSVHQVPRKTVKGILSKSFFIPALGSWPRVGDERGLSPTLHRLRMPAAPCPVLMPRWFN